MSLGSGTRLGPYEIQSAIGAGGMGEVYKARDTRLDRTVAIKVLPAQLSADPDRRARFEREAKTIAGLNHPHICALFDVGESELPGPQPLAPGPISVSFLVMEHLTGETLAQRLEKGPLPLGQALTVATEIADALAAAHRQGVIHRDLKPGNVMLTKAGAKLLDFGLAKLTEHGEQAAVTLLSSAPTQRTPQTTQGTIVGTLQYMAPEQVERKAADARTDLWALGTILYEMLTGKRPFEGGSPASIITAIMSAEPAAVSSLQALTPPGVDRVVRKCLQKDPEARWQSAPDVADELRWLAGGSGAIGAPAAVEGTRRRPGIAWLAGLAAVAVLSLVAVSVALGVGGLRERLVGLFAGRSGAPAAAIRSLAVLPVENYSGDPGQEFFADGMTDALIAGLAQIKAIKVISRTSVMQYKDAKRPLPQIARELGVDGIVEASVMRAGGRVQITAQLLQAREDRHLWAGTYAREMTDVVTLQAELVQAIAHEIQSQLTPQESERLKTARAVDPEVYDATLRGKALLEQGMREEQFQRAVALFQQAVDRDPNYAPAWAGLADSLWSMATAGMEFVAPGDVRARAVAAAEKALELDETLPEAHKARAGVAWDGEWDVAKAKQEFERALELRPGYAAAEYLYAGIFFLQERFDEALRHMNHASELDPLSPWNDFDHVAWWIYQGRGEEAVQEAEAARRRNPTVPHLAVWAAYAHIILGQPDQAAADMEAALKLFSPNRPSSYLGLLGCTYGLAGRRADAQTILSEMERSSRERYISPLGLAWVNAGLGRMDEAFRLLDQALEQRTPYLSVCARSDPTTNVFRRDPRWKPFISRVRALVRLPPGTPDLYQ